MGPVSASSYASAKGAVDFLGKSKPKADRCLDEKRTRTRARLSVVVAAKPFPNHRERLSIPWWMMLKVMRLFTITPMARRQLAADEQMPIDRTIWK
jgi:hypothetical protein